MFQKSNSIWFKALLETDEQCSVCDTDSNLWSDQSSPVAVKPSLHTVPTQSFLAGACEWSVNC